MFQYKSIFPEMHAQLSHMVHNTVCPQSLLDKFLNNIYDIHCWKQHSPRSQSLKLKFFTLSKAPISALSSFHPRTLLYLPTVRTPQCLITILLDSSTTQQYISLSFCRRLWSCNNGPSPTIWPVCLRIQVEFPWAPSTKHWNVTESDSFFCGNQRHDIYFYSASCGQNKSYIHSMMNFAESI